jgi:Na+/H+ antiporter NhaD/arsenite permease-like protein
MSGALILIFLVGYMAIAFENLLKIDKGAISVLLGVFCWTLLMYATPDKTVVLQQFMGHFSEISGILFFLLGAMTLVEIVDAHQGFQIISDKIWSASAAHLLFVVAVITFFLSAILDNLTTTIVMVSILRTLVSKVELRWLFVGIVVVAANAGGAWSPIGDVTTTMLWVKGQITALGVMKSIFLPSLACLLLPLGVGLWLVRNEKLSLLPNSENDNRETYTALERNFILFLGLGVLLFVPVFKTLTHLPPFMGILLGLGIVWAVTDLMHKGKPHYKLDSRTVSYALRNIDSPSILFFLGILCAVAALETSGVLHDLASALTRFGGSETGVAIGLGLFSAVVDNVPLVAAAQGMYTLEQYPTDHSFWLLMAFTSGTGGSILIIGSAAGVAAMGLEDIPFFWYLKRISVLALLGFFAGVGVFLLLS